MISRPPGNISVARGDALVATILGHAEFVAIGEPGQLIRQALALHRGQLHRNRETALEIASHPALNPPHVGEVSDNALANFDRLLSREGDAAGRHVNRHAGEFLSVLPHELARQADFYARVAPSLASASVDVEKLSEGCQGLGLPEDQAAKSERHAQCCPTRLILTTP